MRREFYFAEDYHQQYLAKNPFGYCGHGGTGVSCPIGTGAKLAQAPSLRPAALHCVPRAFLRREGAGRPLTSGRR